MFSPFSFPFYGSPALRSVYIYPDMDAEEIFALLWMERTVGYTPRGAALTVCIIILGTAAGVYSCAIRRCNGAPHLMSQSWTMSLSVKIAIRRTVLSPYSHNY